MERLFPLRRCVSGHVRACRWFFPVLELAANFPARASLRVAEKLTSAAIASGSLAARLDVNALFPRRCHPVCEGVVEVYLRRCCWRPIVVLDPRIDDIIDHLERIPWPPIPDPDPGPIGPDPIGRSGPDQVPVRTRRRSSSRSTRRTHSQRAA